MVIDQNPRGASPRLPAFGAFLRRVGRSRIARSEEGTSGVEFALVLPLMLMLYTGTTMLFISFQARERAETALTAGADILARQTQVSDAVLGDIADVFEHLVQASADRPATFTIDAVANVQIAGEGTESEADDVFEMRHLWHFDNGSNRSVAVDTAYAGDVPAVAPNEMMYVVNGTATPPSMEVGRYSTAKTVSSRYVSFPRYASRVNNVSLP